MPDLPWKEAIIEVLRKAEEPLHYTEIADAIAEQGLKTEFGATPAASVASTISLSFQNEGDVSPFSRVSRAHYSLREAGLASELREALPVEEELSEQTGFINAFGMYWSRYKVHWTTKPHLLGQQQLGSASVDFADQKGVYLLYDGRQVVYVGRTTDQPLGTRLKQHTVDRLNGRWDRFSWFGIYHVSVDGRLSTDTPERFKPEILIATMEALLIEGLEPPQNRKRGDDFRAVEFLQIEDPEIKKSQQVQLFEQLKKKALG